MEIGYNDEIYHNVLIDLEKRIIAVAGNGVSVDKLPQTEVMKTNNLASSLSRGIEENQLQLLPDQVESYKNVINEGLK